MIFKKPKGNQNKIKPHGRKRKLFASTMLILRLLFGGSESASASSNFSVIEREADLTGNKILESPEVVVLLTDKVIKIKGGAVLPSAEGFPTDPISHNPSRNIRRKVRGKLYNRGGDNNQPGKPSKSSPGSKAKDRAKRDFARRQAGKTPNSKQSGGGFFADAYTVERKFPARPGRNRDGLLGRFLAQPTPDPYNPGCANGPRSITVLSGQRNSDSLTNLIAHDRFEAKLTDKSENHITSKHGHKFGVDDPLPRNSNKKPTKYKQTRTRLNNENKAKVRQEIKSILSNPKSDVLY